MTWLEIMVNRALNDPYLNELTRKLELKYAHNFLYQKDDIVLTEKEFDDVLRFAGDRLWRTGSIHFGERILFDRRKI